MRVVNGSVLPWLLVTTANLARNHSRARRRYQAFLADLPRERMVPAAEDTFASQALDLDPRLRAAMRQLSRTDAALVTLVIFEDMTLGDATLRPWPDGARGEGSLHRARRRVRSAVPDLIPAPSPSGATP